MSLDTAERLVLAPRLRRRTIIAAIRSARQRLVLSIFRCDDASVLRALSDAVGRGVHVSAILTARAKASRHDLEQLHAWLGAAGVEVRRFEPAMKYHAKYLVADGQLALVGSLNFTAKCFARTCDFLLVTRAAAVTSGLGELFDADWTGRPAVLSAAQRDRLIVGPDQQPRERFAALVRGARHRIRILDAKLTDPATRQLLDAREGAGISIEIRRRRDVGPLRAHGKLLIVDGAVAVVGSLALSRGALERRRELAIVTRDARVVRQLDSFWQAHTRRRIDHTDAGDAVRLVESAR